ncbi:hypothetical protein [Methylobacterium segetis]|uniref:hypothetical protein n=1 Tax=Methylobacterium segetis TaxID=2488750 RepID=UPI00104A61DB|nr:hypothetical protein [Methylobacterium segetis]
MKQVSLGKPSAPIMDAASSVSTCQHDHQANTDMTADDLLEAAAVPLMRKTIELALSGDRVSLRYCLDRLARSKAARPVPFTLPEVNNPEDYAAATRALLEAVAMGALHSEDAAARVKLLEAHVQALTLQDLVSRLEYIEARKG